MKWKVLPWFRRPKLFFGCPKLLLLGNSLEVFELEGITNLTSFCCVSILLSPTSARVLYLYVTWFWLASQLKSQQKGHVESKGAFVWEYSGIRMHSGIYSGYSAPGSRVARMESRYSGMRIAPKQTLTCIIPIILIPDRSQTNAPLVNYIDYDQPSTSYCSVLKV